jgi:hypothetical protein
MDFAIDFNKAAFDHGVSKEDILMAFDNVEYDAVLEEDDPDAVAPPNGGAINLSYRQTAHRDVCRRQTFAHRV